MRCARVMAAGIELDGASDHGVSEALYLRDYDQNGVELYWDRPREAWPVNAQRRTGDGQAAAGSAEPAGRAANLTIRASPKDIFTWR